MTDPRDEELRFRLRTAAEEHRPDRDAMLARIDRRRRPGQEGGAHRFSAAVLSPAGPLGTGPLGRFRPMAAAASIVAVLALSVGGTWLALDPIGNGTTSDAASAPAAPELPPAPAATSSGSEASASPSAVTSTVPPKPSSSPTPSRPTRSAPAAPASGAVRGWLWSDGAVDPHSISSWSQSNVTLKNTAAITALDVTIKVAVTTGVKTTGSWTSVPNDKVDKDVQEQSGWLYYRFRLKTGATLAPGSYVFAGQFNHAMNGRDPGKDTYLASASAGREELEVNGTF